jgi:hypothetical protein
METTTRALVWSVKKSERQAGAIELANEQIP